MADKTKTPTVELLDDEGHGYRLWVLKKNDYMCYTARRTFDGPSLIYQEVRPTGTKTVETYMDDEATWQWIAELMQDGFKARRTLSDLTAEINGHRKAQDRPEFSNLTIEEAARHLSLIGQHAPFGNDPWAEEEDSDKS